MLSRINTKRELAFYAFFVIFSLYIIHNFLKFAKYTPPTILSLFFALGILGGLIYLVPIAVEKIRALHGFSRFVYAALVSYYTWILADIFPGLICPELLVFLKPMSEGRCAVSFSNAYCLVDFASFFLTGRILSSGVLQGLVFLALALGLIGLVQRTKKWRKTLLFFLFLFLISPFTQGIVLSPGRDSLFTLLFLGGMVGVFQENLRVEKRPSLIKTFFSISAIFFLFDLRPEAKILTVFPLFFHKHLKIFQARNFFFLIRAFAWSMFFWFICTRLLAANDYNFRYQVVALSVPLNEILYKQGAKNIPSDDLENIKKGIDIAKLQKIHAPFRQLDGEEWNLAENLTYEEFRKFRISALNIFLNNPGDFFRNRINMFSASMNMHPEKRTWLIKDYLDRSNFGDNTITSYEIPGALTSWFFEAKRSLGAQKLVSGLNSIVFGNLLVRVLFASPIIPLGILFLIPIFFSGMNSLYLFFPLLVLLRTLLLFLTAYTDAMAYYALVWMVGWILLILGLSEKFSVQAQFKRVEKL